MGKYTTAIIFILFFPLAVSAQTIEAGGLNPAMKQLLGGMAAACTETYAPSLTYNYANSVGRYEDSDFYGLLYTPATNENICKVDMYVAAIVGTLTSGHEYYLRIFTIDGSGDADTIVATSLPIDGDEIDAVGGTAWLSSAGYYFVFSPAVELTGSTTYGFGIFVDQDSDLTDNPEHDGTNYWQFGSDSGNDGDSIQGGRTYWTWDSSIPYLDTIVDATDDILIKVWTQ